MTDRTRARRLRAFLAALMPLGCILVVCDLSETCDPATNPSCRLQPGAQGYEVGIRCRDGSFGGTMTLTAGAVQDGRYACNEQSADDLDTGTSVFYEPLSGGDTFELRCASFSPDGSGAPFGCSGALTLRIEWDSSGFAAGTQPNSLQVGMWAVPLGAEPAGTLDVSARILCPNVAPMELPTDGSSIHFPDLLPLGSGNGGYCDVEVTYESVASAAGDTVHAATIFVATNATQCNSSSQCPGGLRCGPTGCQTGDENQSCTTPYAPVEPDLDLPPLGDCNETAPICTTYFRCKDGNVGDGCRGDTDCAPGLHCTTPLFGLCTP
jgi:hypothetical protein